MASRHEQLIRQTAQRIKPDMPLEYRAVPSRDGIPVRAWTDLRTATVEMDESWNPTGSFLERVGDSDSLEAACRDITAHELAGHNDSECTEGCPGTPEMNAVMKHYVFVEMRKVGKRGVNYMNNAMQDVIGNTIIRGIPGHTNAGITAFFGENLKNPSTFYEAFVKLNLACWGSAAHITHLREHFSNDPRANDAWKAVVADLGLRMCRPEHNRTILSDKNRWGEYARVITKHLAPLLDETVHENTCSHGNFPVGVGDGDPSGEDESSNPFDDALDDPDVQRRVARKFYDEKIGKPAFMPPIEALLRLYESLGNLSIDAKAETQSIGIPVIPYQWTETTDLSKASMTKFGMSPDGKLTLYEPTSRLDIPFHFKQHRTEFPDLVIFALDRSPSMLEELEPGNDTTYIPWGDNSKWHYTLWAWFASTNDLATTGKIKYVKNNSLLFADETMESGAYSSHHLDELRRWILAHPPSKRGGTSIDMDKIRRNCAGRKKVILTISDGEVSNWDSIKKEFLQVTAPHLYAHIQIGPASDMSAMLKRNKRNVYTVTTGKDLIKIERGIIAEAYTT